MHHILINLRHQRRVQVGTQRTDTRGPPSIRNLTLRKTVQPPTARRVILKRTILNTLPQQPLTHPKPQQQLHRITPNREPATKRQMPRRLLKHLSPNTNPPKRNRRRKPTRPRTNNQHTIVTVAHHPTSFEYT
jgi:hypothetical protein